MNTLSLPPVSDYHLHLRQGKMLEEVAPFSSHCGRVLVMPNTNPPIVNASDVVKYRKEINKHLNVEVLMTVKLLPTTTPEIVREAFFAGAVAAKVYPEGVTTNSSDGLGAEFFQTTYEGDGVSTTTPKLCYPRKAKQFIDVLNEMERLGMVLCLHGEMPGCEVLRRESKFLDFVGFLVYTFPELKIVMEHITTHQAVSAIRAWQYLSIGKPCRVAATITPHHLYLTLDDVIGNKISPWNFCKPVAKEAIDRESLRHAALSGERCFFLGSDSAPHKRSDKECTEGCAGVFNAPVLAESMIQLFEKYNSLERLPNFMTHHGDNFYGKKAVALPNVKYVKKTWEVPVDVAGMRPFLAGETLRWTRK